MAGAEDNQRLYLDDRIVGSYARQEQLFAPEAAILRRIEPEIRGQPILDIGVGGGRTTPHLVAVSARYVGIDYSSRMIAACRRRCPGVRFETCDARDLALFEDSEFEMVFFSFNGIDSVDHDDRQRVLKEIRRVLRADCAFVFSSHNRSCRVVPASDFSNLHWSPKPWAAIRGGLQYLNGIRNYYRTRRREVRAAEYAMLVDRGLNYRGVNYYIDKLAQVRQLERAGFGAVEIFDFDGQLTTPAAEDRESRWFHYVARKISPPARG